MKRYAVNWDNGNHACGTFSQRFYSEVDAQYFADNWVHEMEAETDPAETEGEGYSAEVIELDEPSEEELEGEGWDEYGELQRAGLNRGRVLSAHPKPDR